MGKMMANNPFSSRSQERYQEINNLGTLIQEQAAAEQKATELTQQAETLQKAAELEAQLKGNLDQAQANLGEPRITWGLIHERYPQFERKSVLLEELRKADKYLTETEKNQPTNISLE